MAAQRSGPTLCFGRLAGIIASGDYYVKSKALTLVSLKCYIWCEFEHCLLLKYLKPCFARVAELVDAKDLKSFGPNGPCRFDSGPGHSLILHYERVDFPLSRIAAAGFARPSVFWGTDVLFSSS
jgi:hypothetical protein